MIIKLKKKIKDREKKGLTDFLIKNDVNFQFVNLYNIDHVVTSAEWADKKVIENMFGGAILEIIDTRTEYQLSTRTYKRENTVIDIGRGIIFGTNKTVMIAGPCAIESEEQIFKTAQHLKKHNIKLFRAGAYKPRTSPYSFQGLEEEGLKILAKVRDKFDMSIITEVKDETHLDMVAEYADIIQIGTKSMYIFNLLRKCGKLSKPILLKRGFMATIKEFLQAADFIMSSGNPNVILCERGIRAFEPQTRFSLDICSAALLKEISHLPIVLDPSHAMGRAAQVPIVAQAAAALEVDGVMIETHPNPEEAKSDKEQAVSLAVFDNIMGKVRLVCSAVGRELI